jgi:hypothetical protein
VNNKDDISGATGNIILLSGPIPRSVPDFPRSAPFSCFQAFREILLNINKTTSMKQLAYLSLFGLFLLFASCENTLVDDDSPAQDISVIVSEDNAQWRISYFWDKDKDETSDFQGYTFTFESDGKLEAKKGDQLQAGTWSIIQDDGRQKFVIDLGQLRPLEELTDDWLILEKSAGIIKLKDDNDEYLEELHFSKL